MKTKKTFSTVILPIHRHPIYLPLSVSSVLSQTIKNFELFIILDGAPEETYTYAKALADSDSRIKVFKFSKGLRHGEAHRAAALTQATGEIITHINDDSLWMPNHLAVIKRHCSKIDFGHTLHTSIKPNDEISSLIFYLDDKNVRDRMLQDYFNVANFADAFYTREAYENLPEKWSPAPDDVYTDLFMWRKFLRQNLRFGTIHISSTLFFDYPKAFSDEASRKHIERWLNKIKKPENCSSINETVMQIHSISLSKLKQNTNKDLLMWITCCKQVIKKLVGWAAKPNK